MSSHFLLSAVSDLVTLLLVGFLLVVYRLGNVSKLARHASAPVAVGVAIALAAFRLGGLAATAQTAPPPTRSTVLKEFSKRSQTAKADLVFTASGFRLVIPRGFDYTPMDLNGMALVAAKPHNGGSLSVVVRQSGASPAALVQAERASLLKNDPTVRFSDPQQFPVASGEALLQPFEATAEGVPIRGALLLQSCDGTLYHLTVVGPQAIISKVTSSWHACVR